MNGDGINRILTKIESIDKSVDEINITLAKQEVSLEEHIRRTNVLEETLKPIQDHVNKVNAAIAILVGIVAVIGTIKTVLEIISFLK